jgi:hypothetical protein
MTNADLYLDDVVTRLYRAAELISDVGMRELLKNAALALLRADDLVSLQNTLLLTDSLLVTAGAMGFLIPELVTSLREPLPVLLEPRGFIAVAAH